jgi:hypothetical protein
VLQRGRNLPQRQEPRARPALRRHGGQPCLDLVVEGEAAKVSDMVTLHRVAEAYASKYGWSVTVRGGAFYADGAPTAGPPPTRFTKQRPRRSSVLARTGRSARHAGASGQS